MGGRLPVRVDWFHSAGGCLSACRPPSLGIEKQDVTPTDGMTGRTGGSVKPDELETVVREHRIQLRPGRLALVKRFKQHFGVNHADLPPRQKLRGSVQNAQFKTLDVHLKQVNVLDLGIAAIGIEGLNLDW